MSTDDLRTAAIEAAAEAFQREVANPSAGPGDGIRAVVDAVLPLLVAGTASRIADAIEAEPNSHRVHFTDEDGNKDYVDQAHGSKHYAAIARRVGETS